MSSDLKLTNLGNSLGTLKEISKRLEDYAKIAYADNTKVDSLFAVVSEVISAVGDCIQRFNDYKESLG